MHVYKFICKIPKKQQRASSSPVLQNTRMGVFGGRGGENINLRDSKLNCCNSPLKISIPLRNSRTTSKGGGIKLQRSGFCVRQNPAVLTASASIQFLAVSHGMVAYNCR